MRDRWALASFVVGLGAFCAVGLLSGHHLAAVGALVAAVVGGVVTLLTVRARRHRRLVRALHAASVPDELAGTPVRTGQLGDAAFVAGLSRPTIYCDHRLPEQLTPAQLRAVLLHERAHQRALDPARLLLVELVAPVLRRCTLGRQWLAATLARREIAADQHALDHGASRADLAAALLALPPLTRAHVAGFTPAIDLRLRALLGDDPDVRTPPVLRRSAMLIAGGTLGAALCAWFLHQSLAQFGLLCC
jgi:beta-lactamase regulating signal transducer with metallopeptidase domain